MKKATVFLLLAWILMTLAGCSGTQRVRITQNGVWIDNMILTIRQGYKIAEDAYSITETDNGYDIIIHAVKGDTE